MIKTLLFTLAITFFFAGRKQPAPSDELRPVNDIVGDIGFMERFGVAPDRNTPDDLRIRTHLYHVEQVLRTRDVSEMPAFLRERRSRLLDLLHRYAGAGIFPGNYDHPDTRMPCFIDRHGNICAVGYLVQETAGRALAEVINARHRYDLIDDMDMPTLSAWIAGSGLTLQECAMIQPTYADPKPENYIEPRYGIASALWSGVNLSLIVLNGAQIARPSTSKTLPILALIAGSGQLAYGCINFPRDEQTIHGTGSNEGMKTVSLINIALGTGTIILSTANLFTRHKPDGDKPTTWRLGASSMFDGQLTPSLTVSRSF